MSTINMVEDNAELHYGKGGRKNHYDVLWGEANIHLGYYPHLEGSLVRLNFSQAADNLTERMVKLGKINHHSNVLDLGCGPGKAIRDIATLCGARCTGLDLTPANIERARKLASEQGLNNLVNYVQGSFTEFPDEIKKHKYSHIWSQVALCHAHDELHKILEQAKNVLLDNGIMVLCDYLGNDAPYVSASGANFPYLHGHQAWRKVSEEVGLILIHYENLDRHMAQAYADLAEAADVHGYKSKDGKEPMSNGYREAVNLINNRRMGMNLAVLMKISSGGNIDSKL